MTEAVTDLDYFRRELNVGRTSHVLTNQTQRRRLSPYSDSLGGCPYSEGYSSPELARLSGQALIIVIPPCEIPSVLQNLSKTHSRSLQDAINVAQVARRR